MFGSKHLARLPHDFRLSVEDHPQPLKMLLFVRSAWSLQDGTTDLPALDPEPHPGDSSLPDSATRDEWLQRWNREWQRTWDWYSMSTQDHAMPSQAEMQELSGPGQALNPAVPPFWNVEYGNEGLDTAAFHEWDRITRPVLRPQREGSRNMSAMASAWQRGLIRIIVLPYRRNYASQTDEKQLVISRTTRQNPEQFLAALELFQ